MLACPSLQTSSIISARRMVSKIVAPKSGRLGMRRVLVPIFGDRFFGGIFFGGSNGGGCRGSDGRPSSGTAGAADERERHQYQPDREREKAEEAATPIARHVTPFKARRYLTAEPWLIWARCRTEFWCTVEMETRGDSGSLNRLLSTPLQKF